MLAAAFRITGSRTDAEDVVQDSWERWERVDPETVTSPRAFLSVMASRLALNAVRAQRRRRESYVGPWLPDVVVDDGTPEWEVLHQDGLGQALDVVLAALSPEQATAYVLRKVLDLGYAEIAEVLEVSQAAARQTVSRAQRAVESRLSDDGAGRRTRDARALADLARAVASEDPARVVALLSPGSTLRADGGGLVSAALRPVVGGEKVGRMLLGLATRPALEVVAATVNGGAGWLVLEAGVLTTVVTLRTGDEGIEELYLSRNPDRLPQLAGPHAADLLDADPRGRGPVG